MAFDVDEEILQDFLIEAGEILELLQEQLVALENNPDDTDLLNAIFRGFHTVKGGAGFLSLTPMVDVCHEAENTFDLLRTGKRSVTAELMDIILQAVDAINTMFAQTQQGEQQDPADAALLAKLKLLSSGEPLPSELGQRAPEPEPVPEPVIETIVEVAVIEEMPVEIVDSASSSIDEINEAEFEALLDALHGSGKGPGVATSNVAAASVSNAVKPPAQAATSGDDITDDEFEALLDELHGSGKFSGKVEEPAQAKPKAEVVAAPTSATVPTATSVDSDEITDDEFERLLDELHGKGGAPAKAVAKAEPAKPAPTPVAATATPVAPKASVTPAAPPTVKPQVDVVVAEKAPVKAAVAASSTSVPQGETTVRVDTARLDQIMNMVGELVLVRNRLVSLGISRDDEEMSKALANLDLVTADLQGAVMKTRMQPIKKVFGRFPRVVRDLARTLNKEIDLVLVGEETDLDKNLVEALADPLVHLVRNSVDHGIEMPNDREACGKPRTGTITLSASQEGDHILLKIEDDGAGMDPEKLKQIAIKRGVLD
ncbi:MAG: Hpt domain-containing protein, partial [Shewanella sp.]